ncbi:alkaline phosphatase PhoX [Pelagicoccus sp. SDUM812003]|uniref:alkaline phosphatase PhoX n=1 Tax=Pelagicoccus sp. SDUM812003 TaxID=3041267 RepID=UPI00280D9B6E|nr:alkaline phosphatase PhoX [Pelagicoccus sp. SDUM812003]MDQ8201870.1 DUF839 domain-containing protein [Pelagicoccus sp. SDUM812003]
MNNSSKKTAYVRAGFLSLCAASAFTSSSHAGGSDIWFEPLTESAPVVAPNDLEELMEPWVTPSGISQFNIVSLREVEDAVLSPLQSVVRVPIGNNSSMFDMMAYDDTGSFLFIPHETAFGAGVSRHDIEARSTEVIFQGDWGGAQGNWSNDYGAFDPCRFTPNGTLFLAEEWTAEGRVIEVLNPFAAPEDVETRELNSIANVAHEGINFSEQDKRVIYYIDEWNSGSIYKFVMSRPGDYTRGQTFALKVDDYQGVAADLWNDPSNENAVRTGLATWVPLTDRSGNVLPGITDPFRNGPTNDPRSSDVTRGGRPAADDVGATPYGRPEDMEVSRLANGNEVLYIAVTSEKKVYSFEILSDSKVKVGVLASADTLKNVGYAGTTGELNSPDNLAQDAIGNIYIIEDAPNNSDIGGDIWFARDVDNDGVAESLDHFMSIRVDGSEATGMIFNPVNPFEFVVAVQHPDSTDLVEVPDGLGDAVWKFDISDRDFERAVKLAEKRSHDRGKGRKYGHHKGDDHPGKSKKR